MPIIDLFHQSSLAEPKFPGLVLLTHEVAKAVEIGAAAGLALGVLAGTADFVAKKRSPLVKLLSLCELGVSLGCLAGTLLLFGKAHTDETMTAQGIEERAYRLTHSAPGVKHKMDSFFVGGGIIGSIVCGYLLPERWMQTGWTDRITRGFCLGGAIASLPFTVKVLEKMANKQLAEM